MEPLIIPVDCRAHSLDGPPQLGITVEDPNRLRKKQQQQEQQPQPQPQQADYDNHDYQNLDVDILKPRGLQITKIQEGSVIHRIGQFKIGDIIVEVNGVNLQRPFAEAQRTLKQFVIEHTSHGPLILKVFRKSVKPSTPPPAPSPVGEPSTPRSIGVRHRIRLKKAANGFGIKIAQRDNMHSTRNRPICITAITIAGSAYQDGRLKEGDTLLEVNGQDLQGKTQPELTKMLKSIKTNEEVEFVISRREDGVYTYDIPLNDTKSAGLGLYLKYPCRADDRKDLGIWIEKVITGGAAWKDGRLQQDDQILAINGIDIVGLSNVEASETLKKAAVCRGIGPEATLNTIRLRIQRRTPPVVAKILQGTDNRIECSDIITKVNEQNIDNPRVNCNTTLMDTLIDKASETLSSNGSSNHNSQNDSAMSPHTQASNSLKLTNHRNDRSDHSSCDKTNETTSSAISQITDSINNINMPTSQSWDEESIGAANGEDCFQRDGFGRQSMSEKRHAQLNAKNTDTFRRNQRMREEREQQQRDSQHQQLPLQPIQLQEAPRQQQPTQLPSQPPLLQPLQQHQQQYQHHIQQQNHNQPNHHQLQNHYYLEPQRQQPQVQQHQHYQQQLQLQQQQLQLQHQQHHQQHYHQLYQQLYQQSYLQQQLQHQQQPQLSVRMARNRRLNESFRAAVDRTYDASAYHTDTIVVPVDCQTYPLDGQCQIGQQLQQTLDLQHQQHYHQQHHHQQYYQQQQQQQQQQHYHHHQQYYQQQQHQQPPPRRQEFHGEVLVDAPVPSQLRNRSEEHIRVDTGGPRANNQMTRNRKNNKSFRAAIVRPYEAIINCLTKLKPTQKPRMSPAS